MNIDEKVKELNKLMEARKKLIIDASVQKNQYFNKLNNKLASVHEILKKFNMAQLRVNIKLSNALSEAPFIFGPTNEGTLYIKNKKNGDPDFTAIWDYSTPEPVEDDTKKKSSKKDEQVVVQEPFVKIDINSFNMLPNDKQTAMLNVLKELTAQIDSINETAINTIMDFYILNMKAATENLNNWSNLNKSI